MPNNDREPVDNREQPVVIPTETPAAPTDARPTESEKKLGMSMLTKIALVILVLSSFVISISCVMKANQLSREAEEMKNEIAEYKEGIQKIKYFLNEEVDDEYIAKIAREYFDMYFPDEDVYYNDVND